mgnify:CR=1 FL=1
MYWGNDWTGRLLRRRPEEQQLSLCLSRSLSACLSASVSALQQAGVLSLLRIPRDWSGRVLKWRFSASAMRDDRWSLNTGIAQYYWSIAYRDFRANFTVTLCCEVNSGRKWEFQYQRGIANGTYFHSCTGRARVLGAHADGALSWVSRTE